MLISIAAYSVDSRMEMERYIDDIVMYSPMNGAESQCNGNCINGRLTLDINAPTSPNGLSVN